MLPMTAAGMKKDRRQLNMAAMKPAMAHAVRWPTIRVMEMPKLTRPRALPWNQVAIILTTGVHSMDCATPFKHQPTSRTP